MRNATGYLIDSTGNHHTPGAVADKHNVGQVLILNEIDDVADVDREVNFWTRQVYALAQARQCRRVYVVAGRAQECSNALKAPPAMPCTVYQYESRHALLLDWTGPRRRF